MAKHGFRSMAAALPLLMMVPHAVVAQSPEPPPQGAPPPAAQAAQGYSTAQIDQMLAPIALYPDQLLTQILMASTYTVDIVEAARWLENPENAALKGDALAAALQPLPWAPSVKALVPFPQVITQMNDHLDWTQSLGAAFANQQVDVMNQVQVLRQQAEACGQLKSTQQMTVEHQGPAIVLAPPNPETVYVPVYDPAVVYGAWAYPAYPPFFWPAPVGFWGPGIALGFGFGFGFSVGFGVVGPLWGWASPVWGTGGIYVNNAVYNRITNNYGGGGFAGGMWHHDGPVGASFAHGAGFAGGRTGFSTPGGGYVRGSAFNDPSRAAGRGAAGVHGATGGRFAGARGGSRSFGHAQAGHGATGHGFAQASHRSGGGRTAGSHSTARVGSVSSHGFGGAHGGGRASSFHAARGGGFGSGFHDAAARSGGFHGAVGGHAAARRGNAGGSGRHR